MPPIPQTLASRILDGNVCTLTIVDAKSNAAGIPELELVQEAVQVLFLAVLISASHAALEDRIITLNRDGVDIAADVFIL